MRVRPKKWFSWEHLFQEGTRQVAFLSASPFRRNAKALIDETEYQLDREAAFSGKFFIKSGNTLVATADRTSFLRHSYVLTYGDAEYTFRLTSFLKGSFGLFEKEKEAGSVARESLLSRTTLLKFPSDLSTPVAVFLFWLVLLSRRRRSRVRY